MARGQLRVLLGAAPGVGKTYAMLDEGRTLIEAGKDVVIGVVETHGRAATAAMTEGLEILPRRTYSYRGVDLTEMDVDAIIERSPDVVLVDELAHTNAPGSAHEKRWEDVDEILDAGIDVISTVNIQHIESLNDVVEEITGVQQRETIPDEVLRAANQVEVVDLAPQALRDRLSAGHVYSAERIDAALSNYFRLGNLTALRELALRWVANEVDVALLDYRGKHGIADAWEARERVVVALPGGAEGESLLRRGARIVAHSGGGELVAVHIIAPDGLRAPDPARLDDLRRLAEHLGGSYHQVVGDDIPATLVEFAKAVNATQLVVGATRRPWLLGPFAGPDIGKAVIRAADTIDVHIVNTAASAKRLALPKLTSGLTVRRRLAGFILTILGMPALTWLLTATRTDESLTSDILAFQVLAVVVALVGGIWPALVAAVLSGVLTNYYLVPPTHTLTIGKPAGFVALVLSVVVVFLVSFVVDRAARQTRATRRTAAESEVLMAVAGSVLRGQDAVAAILDRIGETFRFTHVRLVRDGTVVAEADIRAEGPDGTPDRHPGPEAQDLRRATSPSPTNRGTRTRDDGDPDATRQDDTGSVEWLSSAEDPEALVPSDKPVHARPRVPPPHPPTVYPVGEGATLEVQGPDLTAGERRLMAVLLAQLEAAVEVGDLTLTASEVEPLAASERVRTALLAALSHDLRRPLAAATAAVSGLQSMGDALSEADRHELVSTAAESLTMLSDLVDDLLDVSKLQAGVLVITRTRVELADAIIPALEELHLTTADVELNCDSTCPPALADPVLLQRAIVNLLLNAQRYAPEGTKVRIATSAFADTVEIRIIDHGPGVPPGRLDDIFLPFQRHGDTDNTTGLGLGLALSKGFIEGMGGKLLPEDTPGGGLTMVVSLEAFPESTPTMPVLELDS